MIDRRIMSRWADAMNRHRHEEANALWAQLMADWLKPPATDQRYWNRLLDRRMAVLERREQRAVIDDVEWDIRREDVTR
jgi:phenylalanine-4-hydroxylase